MGSSTYNRHELDVLNDVADKLAELTLCGTHGAVLDLGRVSLAKWRLDLIDRSYSEFDNLFKGACEKFSYQENIDIPEKFPAHKFVFFEETFEGMLTTDEMYQGLHYCIGEKGYSVQRY